MRNYVFLLFLATGALLQAQIITFQDVNFKNALLNTDCVDIDNNGTPDVDADLNNDGEIDINEAENILGLYIKAQNITSFDGIENFTNLQYLNGSYNDLSSVDISQNIDLTYVNLNWNVLTEIDLSQNIQLEKVFVGDNQITELDVSMNPNIKSLYCSNTEIANLELSNNQDIEILQAQGCNLSSIDLSQNRALKIVRLGANNLTEIDVSNNINLERLFIGPSDISDIDLSQNVELDYLGCHQCNFESIDVSANTQLEDLYIWGNSYLTSLDVSQNVNLDRLVCYNMDQLLELNVQNGNNYNFTYFSAFTSPRLECIQVDDPAYSNSSAVWFKDIEANYSEDCEYLEIQDIVDFQELKIFPNPVSDALHLQFEYPLTGRLQLTDLQGRIIEELKVSNAIDVSSLRSGIYFLRILENGTRITKKFVKK